MSTEPKTLVVSFAGNGLAYGGVPKIEFKNFLKQHFSHFDAQFYIDDSCQCYHHGMQGISKNIDETTEYLRAAFEGYDRIICLGSSAGGYAAILFGSLLKVDSVIAFIPQTVLTSPYRDERYRNLKPHINPTTNYFLYGDISIDDVNNCHHISQCENIAMLSNVKLHKLRGVNLKALKHSGQLLKIIQCNIEGKEIPIERHIPHLGKFNHLHRFFFVKLVGA